MQVLCRSTTGNAETRCCICGQGFVMFWERQSRAERVEALWEIQKALRSHHRDQAGTDAHPSSSFLVPEWNGPIGTPGAAVPGQVPTWAI